MLLTGIRNSCREVSHVGTHKTFLSLVDGCTKNRHSQIAVIANKSRFCMGVNSLPKFLSFQKTLNSAVSYFVGYESERG